MGALNEKQLETIQKLVDELSGLRKILFVTGAGMSADSGLPTYRGVGGLYNHDETVEGLRIEECLSKRIFDTRPELTWKYLGQIEEAARQASFNRGHEVIVEFEKRYSVSILTQNVDGFHLLAGSKNVIEIHGTMRRLRCTGCSLNVETDSYEGLEFPPVCDSCNAMLRPDVVLFDEMLPVDAMAQYERVMSAGFDVVFSVGTTSAFPYIASPIYLAKENGWLSVEINPGTTHVSEMVDYRLDASAAVCLDEISKRLNLCSDSQGLSE